MSNAEAPPNSPGGGSLTREDLDRVTQNICTRIDRLETNIRSDLDRIEDKADNALHRALENRDRIMWMLGGLAVLSLLTISLVTLAGDII